MSKSIDRVEAAARAAGLAIAIQRMPDSTRTAGEAARKGREIRAIPPTG